MSAPEDTRAAREQTTRDAESRETPWVPPTALPDPHAKPGVVYRWIRTASMGQPDPVNVSQSFREGWTPVNGAEYPELKILVDHNTRWPDGIEVGGLLLCCASVGHIKQRQDYYSALTKAQMKSVNDQLEAEEDPRLRTIFRQHESSVTRGFGPVVRKEQPR
jgi:hypothetical protein